MRIRSSVVACLLALTPALACAQIRASEHGTVTQRVSGTTISVEYDRPVARGRTLFGDGGVVHWGDKWTPGANWATTIEELVRATDQTDQGVSIDQSVEGSASINRLK